MKDVSASKPMRQYLPWLTAGLFLILVILYRTVDIYLASQWPVEWRVLFHGIFISAIGAGVFWLAEQAGLRRDKEGEPQQRLMVTERLLSESYQRVAALFRIRQQFYEAEDESVIVNLVLQHSVDLTGAAGASFVPLDERGQPMAAVNFGQPSLPLPEAWMEYLATPAIRDRCRACENHNHLVTTCPLLEGPFSEVAGIYCVPLRRGDREYGVLNLYISDADSLDAETKDYFNALIEETALALEGVWMRKRELMALGQLQSVRQKADLVSLLSGLLENVSQSLEPDFALLVMRENSEAGPSKLDNAELIKKELIKGKLDPQSQPFIEAIVQSVLSSGEPVNISSSSGNVLSPPGVRALLAVPLVVDNSPLGILLIGNRKSQNFNQRHLVLMQTVAGQIALVIQNAQQLSQLEYKAIIDERTRLAREIHDGLAQTLGFLKLQVAQMQGHIDRGDLDRLRSSMKMYYETLSETYQEARYAIDGLRIFPVGGKIDIWLNQMLAEFQENVEAQSISVSLSCLDVKTDLPSEVQAQLIRIVQEGLSNIRKHAQAKNVWVSCYEKDNELFVEIQDDGRGFAPEDVPGPSQHGLRGMRERADLIGAEFQVISTSQTGTTVRISLQLEVGEVSL
jgi:two-component system, NarL family, nitrate/nitrite sensor histidine kinase NarX